jgi:hypothetical protein
MEICRQISVGRNSRRTATNAQKAFWEFLTNTPKDIVEMQISNN